MVCEAQARLFPVPIVPHPLEEMQGVDGTSLPSGNLKSYIELNRFVIAAGLTGPYRLWLLCRALDPEGRGTVDLDVLLVALAEQGLNRQLLRRTARQAGCSTFLTIHPTYVEYRSLTAVCRSLAVTPGRAVFIPRDAIQSTEHFRAALYTAWIAGHDSLYISREKLTALFDVSADTQRRWERLTGVEVTYNVIEVAASDQAAAEAHIPQDARLDGDRMDRVYTWEYQGRIYYRTVNRYQAPHYDRGCVGNVRKVSRAVRAAVPVEGHGDGTRRRVFYTARTTPANYQEKPESSLQAQRRVISTARGPASLWRFSRTRPVARREVLC